MSRENVYIIIPVHNRRLITLACLENLKANGDLQKYHVIVVDDGSSDRTSEEVAANYPEVTILKGDGNLWWTGAIALGMKYAYEKGAEYFIWLNDDCLVARDCIDKIVALCKENQNSIVGCQGISSKSPNLITFGGKRKINNNYQIFACDKDETVECDLLSGNLVCLPSNIINIIQYPNTKLTPHYGGDAYYLIKARKAGFRLLVNNSFNNIDIFCESSISPQRWLLQDGNPLDIFKLIFNHKSLYSWRIFLSINQLEYGNSLGIFMFVWYYNIYYFFPISLITLLRFLPFKSRQKLSNLKQKIVK